jgi:hypothetical protein
VARRKSQLTTTMLKAPSRKPNTGEKKIPSATKAQPSGRMTASPALTTAAPRKPPIRACEELVGRANNQVMMFHTIAASTPAKMTVTLS